MSESRSRIGRHLPTSGGLKKTLERAESLGCETVQIFVSNPQGWAVPPERPDARAFVKGSRELGLSPVVVHAKYLINLASQKREQREMSVEALAREMVAAGEVGADLLVVHSGSHGGDGEEKGMERLVGALDRARELAAKYAGSSPVAEPVIENSAGAGTQLCSTFEDLGNVARRAGARVCVDTAHAFVAGYDLVEQPGEVAKNLEAELGRAIGLIHLNDAKNELGSHRDGHRRIGEGNIPLDAWAAFFGALSSVPVAMETPYATPEVDAEQIRLVKKLANGLAKSDTGDIESRA